MVSFVVETSAAEEANSLSVLENSENEGDDDQAEFHASGEASNHSAIQPRWPTRVFAAKCVRKLISACQSCESAHFDVVLAKEMQLTKSTGKLIMIR